MARAAERRPDRHRPCDAAARARRNARRRDRAGGPLSHPARWPALRDEASAHATACHRVRSGGRCFGAPRSSMRCSPRSPRIAAPIAIWSAPTCPASISCSTDCSARRARGASPSSRWRTTRRARRVLRAARRAARAGCSSAARAPVVITSPGRVSDRRRAAALKGRPANTRLSDGHARPPTLCRRCCRRLACRSARSLRGGRWSRCSLRTWRDAIRCGRSVPMGRRPRSQPNGAAPLDQEMIDRLRSLGYVR